MPKAIVIVERVGGNGGGRPNVGAVPFSWVHCADVDLPGGYMAFVVSGTGAQLQALAAHPKFLLGQQIVTDPETGEYDWESARVAIEPEVRTMINSYLQNKKMETLGAGDNIVTLIQRFNPAFEPGDYDVN